ncbi:bifunctional adenosylcobinamide kinase/adenosylcobinamide-phosphate guanylyltransferase [Pseudoalteromonas luteoviolacea]|uniref:Bifunctional adenosylcobalamin biosynthesis protein n=1 Tax=Pseudoalteromonas luteoviolacea S4054 TaxID=1129367 RepID=A0A0F6AGH7_9GAMM|nr:bifunctional adenosylcobinamide kinase/adenosylcobinamide-phosphate guanylyltransferase [Pseudoalteromonas luteoviolacea]AOT07263.1 bifunctional adenosylcobinamide kinase/adenosylcobinamide-phosphate guanylyltransferase [Pseudoalteromonas luteoviolacea]AOT12178.1 bifunctional adenosylcobinamide kinase/adenosylcobinamide-phosphate guanylyltransferase [Pseudoalteromonas luteoviolacea]AOT17091.1 bifunctional adenosylcobinamide kinase/adenosylcobinamide-phosphate guanylyltransferase [Pseudoaltero
MTKHVELILGGARSGKSTLAEQRAQNWLESGSVKELIYVATAQSKDEEMAERIAHHQASRLSCWNVIECPWDIVPIIANLSSSQCALVDCLTLWLTHGLCEVEFAEYEKQKSQLVTALQVTKGKVILVSNEVGHGIVPMGALSRQFVDESGRLHQDIAAVADHVDFVMAGLALNLKK